MIISDLNYLESVSEATAVVGGTSCDDPTPTWSEWDSITIDYTTSNTFNLDIGLELDLQCGNFASAGAKGVADANGGSDLNSFTKADTLALATYSGGSVSSSTSVAAIGY